MPKVSGYTPVKKLKVSTTRKNKSEVKFLKKYQLYGVTDNFLLFSPSMIFKLS